MNYDIQELEGAWSQSYCENHSLTSVSTAQSDTAPGMRPRKIVSVEKWSEHKSVWKAQNWFKREDCSFKYLRNIQHRQGKYSTRYCEPEYLPSNLSAHDLKTWRTELISQQIRLSQRHERYSLQTPSKPIKWVKSTHYWSYGWTAFMIACYKGHKDVVKLLLDHSDRIELNARGNDEGTALM